MVNIMLCVFYHNFVCVCVCVCVRNRKGRRINFYCHQVRFGLCICNNNNNNIIQHTCSSNFGFFFNLFYLFIFGCVGSLLLHGLSLAVVSGGYSSLWCTGFSLRWLLLLRSTGSRCTGFSSCSMWAQ